MFQHRAERLLERISNVFGPVATTSSANDIMVWPATIRAHQRLIEAAASSPSTGLPSWKRSPSLSECPEQAVLAAS